MNEIEYKNDLERRLKMKKEPNMFFTFSVELDDGKIFMMNPTQQKDNLGIYQHGWNLCSFAIHNETCSLFLKSRDECLKYIEDNFLTNI